MPTIPRTPLPRVNPYGAAPPGVPREHGLATTRALVQVGQELKTLGYFGLQQLDIERRKEEREAEQERQKKQHEHDAAKILSMESDALTKWHRESREGDHAYFKRKGEDAFGISQEGQQFYQTLVDESLARAENETQRFSIQRLLESHWETWRNQLSAYESGEQDRFAKTASDARIEVAKRDATYNWADPQALARDEAAISASVRAVSKGLASEVIASVISQHRGAMYVGAIEGAINAGNLDRAKELLEQGKNVTYGGKTIASIAPDVVAQLSQALQGGKQNVDASLLVDEIRAQDLSRTEELEKAQEISDPALRQKVIGGLRKKQIKEDNDIEQARISENEQAWQLFQQLPDQDISMLPPQFDEKQVRLATESILARASGKTIQSNPETIDKLEHMIVENPDKFKKVHIALEMATTLSPRDRAHYIGIQSEMRGHAAEDKVLRIANVQSQIHDTMVDFGIDRGTDDATKLKRNQLKQYFYQEIMRAGFRTDNVPQEELNRIKATAALQGEVWSGHALLPDTNVRYFQTVSSRADRDRYYYSDIPRSVTNQIEAEIVSEGRTPDWPEVNRRYVDGIRSGRWQEGEEMPPPLIPTATQQASEPQAAWNSFTFDIGNGQQRTYALPTMVAGRRLSPQEAVAIAKEMGLDKFPSFETVDEAEAWIAANHGNIAP